MIENKIIHGDSLEVLKNFENNSIDSIITDPPYGYSFLGRDWDKFLPDKNIWTECLRVLKPGAFAFIMAAPRQDVLSKAICQIGDTGFDIGFTSLYWAYSSGFPKAMNISQKVDDKLGFKREILQGGLGSKGGTTYSNEGGWKAGQHKSTEPVSEQAKKLNGSYAGFQPKPAVECIIVAMKPLSAANYTEQALENGKGITWLDDGRIPNAEGEKAYAANGRFPANLLVSDGCLDEFSKFFDLNAWAKKLPFLPVCKPNKAEKGECKHPTIKPIELMSYLITIGSRENDLVLDPFIGSGTTALACKKLNRRYIGIELDEENYKEACERLEK